MSEKRKMSKKKKILLIIAAIGLLSVFFFAGIEFSCTAWFCTTCHEMKSYGDSWELSKHGPYNSNSNMKNCMKCHSQPGFVGLIKAKINGLFSLVYHLTGDYHLEATQPVVCIRDGCHQLEDLDRARRPDRTVKMNHEKHVKVMKDVGTRYQCMPCHRNIAHGKDKFLPDMKKDCFLCHSKDYQNIRSANCALCHSKHPNVHLEGEETLVPDLHKDAQVACVDCHAEGHEAKAKCQECHESENYSELVVYEKEKEKETNSKDDKGSTK